MVIFILVMCLTCAVGDFSKQKRKFVPSESMDTEGGWRVIQSIPSNQDGLSGSETNIYLHSPNLGRLSDKIGEDFLNNDEQFRINVMNTNYLNEGTELQHSDSLPVASSYVATGSFEHDNFISPLRTILMPPNLGDELEIFKPPMAADSEKYITNPMKFPLTMNYRKPAFNIMVPETMNYPSLTPPRDIVHPYFSNHSPFPKMLHRNYPFQLYEIDTNARPIVLSEEITYEGRPFISPKNNKDNFPNANVIRNSFIRTPRFSTGNTIKFRKLSQTKPSSKFHRSHSKGTPIIRGRFWV